MESGIALSRCQILGQCYKKNKRQKEKGARVIEVGLDADAVDPGNKVKEH
jgi:hypothetical protein